MASPDLTTQASAHGSWTASKPVPEQRTLKWFGAGLAVVAAFALLVLLWPPIAPTAIQGHQIATTVGEHRVVQLADGSTIALNGSSRLWISDARNRREVELVKGEALFTVRHDSRRPFILRLGQDQVEDLGTQFNVIREQTLLKVEVAEGVVRFRRAGYGVQLGSGQTLKVRPSGDAIVGHKNPASIASWRSGQLEYENVPVAEVAADLGRNLGVVISVDGKLAYQPFTGSVRVGRPAPQVVREFASSIAGRARKSGGGWLID